MDRDHNKVGMPYLARDDRRADEERSLAKAEAFVMNDAARASVAHTMREHAAIRGWTIVALNVRTNHVHVVVDCKEKHTPEQAMQQFKMWSTRRLHEAGIVTRTSHLWTDHGSTRYIKGADSLMSAVHYAEHCQ